MKHKCLTCFKEFGVEQSHYRCGNSQCDEIDEKLSAHMKNTTQIRGRVIEPGSKKGWPKGEDRQQCPQCNTPTLIRLCPHCHDQLPTALDGVRSFAISVVGPRGAGKSLYLISAIDHMERHVFPKCLNTYFELSTEHTKSKYQGLRDRVYQSGMLLPPSNLAEIDPEILIPFVFHTKVKSYRSGFYPLPRKKRINIAAFDVAGEACEDLIRLQANCPNLPKHEALIILIDPTYYMTKNGCLPSSAQTSVVPNAQDPIKVITNVKQHIIKDGNKIPIPTAFVVTKLDALKHVDGFSAINSILETDKHNNGFNATYCEEVSNKLKIFLEHEQIGAKKVVKMAEEFFKHNLFFGVTSLGKPPVEVNGMKRADNIHPGNTESPWLWILHKLHLLSEVNDT